MLHYFPLPRVLKLQIRRYASKNAKKSGFNPSKLRNIGIVAHVDAGKTTTCERMLYYAGRTETVGDVDDGDTVMDFLDMERDRGITINSATISLPWRKHLINIIDTPGHVDFTFEVERSARVLDGAVTILDAVAGVQAQTETVWTQIKRYGVPSVVFVNKMDREGASFESCVASMKNRLYIKPLLLQLPVGAARGFSGVIDLVQMELLEWGKDDYGADIIKSSIDGNRMEEQAIKKREELIQQVADLDDELLENYLAGIENGSSIRKDDLYSAIKRVAQSFKGVPVMCGSSLKNKGVQPVLDSIIDYLPSPVDKRNTKAKNEKGEFVELIPDPGGPICCLAFKVMHDEKKGMITYLRVYSGTLKFGEKLRNTSSNNDEKPSRMFKVFADDLQDVKLIKAGDICACLGLKNTKTGDTLVGKKDPVVHCEGIKFPEPVFYCSVILNSPSEEEDVNEALRLLKLEDPSVRVSKNLETGQLLLSAMGELHMEIIQDRLLKHYSAKVTFGDLYVAYSNSGAYVEIKFELDMERNSVDENEFIIHSRVYDVIGGVPDKKLREAMITSLQQGASDAFTNGNPPGFPFHDVKVTLCNIQIESSIQPINCRNGMFKAILSTAKKSELVLLEPVMKLEIQVDSTFISSVIPDLTNRRRGRVGNMDPELHNTTLNAYAPLKELVGYSTALRTNTKGTGSFTMEFSQYEELPHLVQNDILKEYGHFNLL